MSLFTIDQAGALLRARRISAVELAQDSLRRIHEQQPRLNAFITITEDLALQQARRADEELAAGLDRGPLHGIPYALKDCFITQGIRTTNGSRISADYIPDFDSAACTRLTQDGAVLMGKTGLHELCYGITSNNPHFGAVRNPHNPDHIPGGSSGGSAVAVATGMVFFAMGTDTGGSIRIPAAYCGCVGFKPTFGAVDTYGVMPLSVTQDHAGPLTRTARDAAQVLRAFTPLQGVAPGAEPGRRIGIPSHFFNEGLSPAVAAAFEDAIRRAAATGCQIIPVSVPDPAALNAVGRTILLCEASGVMQRYLHRREDFGSDVLALLEQGLQVPPEAYLEARRLREVYRELWEQVWKTCDFLFTPTVAIEAPLIGQELVESEDVRVISTRFVRPFNVLGSPALSLPLPVTGLPVGLQIAGPAGSDAALLALAQSLELPG